LLLLKHKLDSEQTAGDEEPSDKFSRKTRA